MRCFGRAFGLAALAALDLTAGRSLAFDFTVLRAEDLAAAYLIFVLSERAQLPLWASFMISVAVMALVTTRQLPPALMIFGIGHVLVWLCMQGPKMAAHYEGRPEWQKRWGLDEDGVRKLRASVTRSASSIPALILFALMPRDNAGAALAILALSGFGLLLAGRTLGVLMLGWAGLVTVAAGAISLGQGAAFSPAWVPYGVPLVPMGILAGLMLIASTIPFVRTAAAYLRKLR